MLLLMFNGSFFPIVVTSLSAAQRSISQYLILQVVLFFWAGLESWKGLELFLVV